METPIDSFNAEQAAAPQRPQFLSVLCILTWITCGFVFISTVGNILFQKSPEEQMEQIEQMRSISPEAADQMEAALDAQNNDGFKAVNTAITLIACGLSAFGAVMMWQLRKKGFFLYIAGELIPYLSFAFGGAKAMSALGAMGGMSGSAVLGITIAVMALFDGIFIAMYAANTKHMTNA